MRSTILLGLPLSLACLVACAADRSTASAGADADASTSPKPPPTSSVAVAPDASSSPSGSPAIASAEVPDGPIVNDPALHGTLRAIAAQQTLFYRADGLWWAPFDCRAPPDDGPLVSSAPEGVAHGRKLYTLRIADFVAYAQATGSDATPKGHAHTAQTIDGVSQAVVKVSYEPLTEKPEHPIAFGVGSVTDHGTTYWPGRPRDLFIMYQPTTAGADIETDAGWLYGTVSPDGKTVTSAGKVVSCMHCHARAPHGRLFGVR